MGLAYTYRMWRDIPKSIMSLDNYSSISLINVDVKILAYTLAQRLKIVFPNIVIAGHKGYAEKIQWIEYVEISV